MEQINNNYMDIIIDASWMSRWSLYSIKSTPTFFANSKEKDSDKYLKQLAINFKRIMLEIEPILTHDSKIIYALDYASWRKAYQTNEGEVYKGNRIKDEALMDWGVWSDINIEFGKILEKFGVIFAHHKGLEADDTAYIWSRMLNKVGRSCVLIASDGDWKQLISGNTYYLKKRGSKNVGYDFVKIPEPKQKANNSRRRSFNNNINNKPIAYRLLESNYDSVLENPYTFIFDKIVYGDKKDNIFPIYSIPSKKDKDESNKKQSEIELLLLEGVGEERAKEIVDNKYRDLWEKEQLDKFKSKYKKTNGLEAEAELITQKRIEISNSKRKYVSKKPNKSVYQPILDEMGVIVDNFDVFYDQEFVAKFTGLLINEMGGYDEKIHDSVIEKFNLNVKLLHLHKRNIPHDLIKKCLKGWDENKIKSHHTNVYDLFDENNIVPQSTLKSIDIMDMQFEGITNDDFFEW